MIVYIRFDKKCPITKPQRDNFIEFLKLLTILRYKELLQSKEIYINGVLSNFKITAQDIEQKIDKLIRIDFIYNGIKIYLAPSVIIHNRSLVSVLKAFDFGSEQTGLPKLLFFPILQDIRDNISRYYLRFLGIV